MDYAHSDSLLGADRLRLARFIVVGALASWAIGFMHTSRRRVEERQRQLEFEIAERMQMSEALREADRRKDMFLATLAHELRNPLAPLVNALEIWPSVAGDAARTEQLRSMMDRQIRQMIRLIDDLLDVSRITRGKIQLRVERVDLRDVVSDAIESIRPMVQSCQHRLTVSMPEVPLWVEGDTARLTQIFGNVLHNAAKYTVGDGAIDVAVAVRDQRAVVSVHDNGPGIPPEMLKEIFEMFHQVDQTLDRAHGGLGIGLTLAKRLIEMHGGHIEAHSDGVGKGSQFILTLPLCAPASPQPQPLTTTPRRKAPSVPAHRVLVVDDLPELADSLAALLGVIGQEVWTAHDGPSAIDAVLAHRPDVVFLDIAMPGMDGYQVAQHLRAREELRGTVLVALTGYGQEQDRERALAAGFDHHLTKPTSLDALGQVLSQVPTLSAADSNAAPANHAAAAR